MTDEVKAVDDIGNGGLRQIEELCAMAVCAGQWNYSPYLRGYANALLLAVSILRETKWQPMPPPSVYLQDLDKMSNIGFQFEAQPIQEVSVSRLEQAVIQAVDPVAEPTRRVIDASEGKPCRFDVGKLCPPTCGRRIGVCARRSW
jgi:hypothetical protein